MSEEISTTPVETTQVPVNTEAREPTPVEKSTPTEPKPDKPDLDTAIKRAYDKAKATADAKNPPKEESVEKAKPAKVETKPEPKPEQPRENGRFVSREPKEPSVPSAEQAEGSEREGKVETKPSEGRDYSKPPAHFLPRAKEAWSGVNPDVQGEVHRMAQNYEKGIAEYKESHENWQQLREFDQQAKAAGTTIPEYIRNVRAIEQLIQTNPIEGFRRVLATANITPEQYARHVLQQPQQQQHRPQQDTQTQQQLSRMQQIIEQQQKQFEELRLEKVADRFITPFKADHERYDELEEDIAFFLNSGKIPSTLSERERLEAAYDMAERINPAPKSATPAPGTPAPQPRPLNPAGLKSVTGSPSPGLSITKGPSKEDAKDLDAILRRSLAKATAR